LRPKTKKHEVDIGAVPLLYYTINFYPILPDFWYWGNQNRALFPKGVNWFSSWIVGNSSWKLFGPGINFGLFQGSGLTFLVILA